ncbi:hypothetical protein WA556_006079 [Blastocystis sp. ATCC 50177/Nand II]
MKTLGVAPNFAGITVSLVNSYGYVQEQTECSPQGYFFIPIYDIGEYSLTIAAKDGWYVSPRSFAVSLSEEGSVVGCEDKTVFEITGFHLSGHTHHAASAMATKGIRVSLLSTDNHVLKSVETDENGDYNFENVPSGEYVLKAEHSSWVLAEPSTQMITIGFGSVKVNTDFVVTGFKIAGVVENQSGSHAITGIQMQISSDNAALDCASTACTVAVAADGSFEFRNLQSGVYMLTPSLTAAAPAWTLQPSHIRVTVKDDSVSLGAPFAVTGFALTGRVVDEAGEPMPGVCIGVNSHVTEACTDAAGAYTLPEMQEKLYMIDAHKEGFQFTFVKVAAEPGLRVPDLTIDWYVVCGKVESALIRNMPTLPSKYTVEVRQGAERVKEYSTPEQFCVMLKPGVYDFAVAAVAATAHSPALAFTEVRGVTCGNHRAVEEIVMRPIAKKISGEVKVLADAAMTVELFYGEAKVASVQTDAAHRFVFEGVLSGAYSVRVSDAKGCWGDFADATPFTGAAAEEKVTVGETDVAGVVLTQRGYVMTVHAVIPTEAELVAATGVAKLALVAGVNRFCVSKKHYRLIPHGCYKCMFDELPITAEHPAVELVPSLYRLEGEIVVNEQSESIVVVAKLNGVVIQEVPAVKRGPHFFYSMFVPQGEIVLSYLAPASSLLFHPRSQTVRVVANQCQPRVATVQGHKGRVVTGQIIPALPDVRVMMEVVEEGVTSLLEALSDEKGFYAFSAIEPAAEFISWSLEAVREGHVFHKSADGLNFSHQKLSSLTVRVVDSEHKPVAGALLSLSSTGYNSNEVSRADGSFVFGQLFPGEYYLHAQLKEFAFKPATQIVPVTEGSAVTLEVACERVAWSVFGRVSTITGQPLAKQRVVAVGVSGHKESAVSDAQGAFRLRGLHEGETYKVEFVSGGHVIPAVHEVVMKKEDVLNQNFVVLSDSAAQTVVGVVESNEPLMEGVKVVVNGKKTVEVSESGVFEVPAVAGEAYALEVKAPSGTKMSCEKKTVVVEKDRVNEVALKCEVKTTGEMEVANGGSFFLLAVAIAAIFVYVERKKLGKVF